MQTNAGAWEKLPGALNLAGAAPGERRDAGDGAPPLSGIVEPVNAAGNPYTLLRVDQPAPGVVFATASPAGKKAFVTVNLYLYGDTGAGVVARDQSAWTAWMKKLFAA